MDLATKTYKSKIRLAILAKDFFGGTKNWDEVILSEIFSIDSLRFLDFLLSLEEEFGVDAEQLILKLVEIRTAGKLIESIVREIEDI